VRSETARCYYGFSSAPVEAKVEVVSADNSNQVATVLVNEKDGFIKLQADNFTFSSPTIRIKLAQGAAITPSKPVQPVAVKATKLPKQITLTCIKGKTVKKVVGTSPKCPAGFKKK
jgi:hypothetical protein